MNKSDKEFINRLKNEIKEETELPRGLSKEYITATVKGRKQQDRVIPYKKWVAVAASFVLVVAAVIIGGGIYKSSTAVELPGDSDVTVQSDYSYIEAFFIEKKGEMKNNGSFFNGLTQEKAEAGMSMESSATSGSDSSDTGDKLNSSYGTTTLQVDGVDEADIIKNDGNYIYYVARPDYKKICIVDTRSPESMKIVSTITVEATAEKTATVSDIYVKGDKLIVIMSSYTEPTAELYDKTFGNDMCCYCGSADNTLTAVVYDITERANPVESARYGIDGREISSRLVGNKLYLVSNYIVALYNDDEMLRESCVPSYYINSQKSRVDAQNISIIRDNDENTYTVVLEIDLENGKTSSAAVLGGGSEIYCNGNMLYVSRFVYESMDDGKEIYSVSGENTIIYAFDITDGVKYKCSGKVNGSILNQFSMDEYNGYFRIATTTSGGSMITVLDKELKTVGKVDGIAKDERIYAVRFMGDTAYVVTFLQTDPLFVIDLSVPSAPVVKGELKLPGFSSMLYPYSENLIVGIGKDGDDNGANDRIKISLFDISDSNNPVEISKAIVGSNCSSSSEAEYNHKAYLDMGDGSFSIPIQIYPYQSRGVESYLCCMGVKDNKLVLLQNYKTETENDYVIRGTYTGNTVFVNSANYASTEPASSLTAFSRQTGEILSAVSVKSDADLSEKNYSGETVVY